MKDDCGEKHGTCNHYENISAIREKKRTQARSLNSKADFQMRLRRERSKARCVQQLII